MYYVFCDLLQAWKRVWKMAFLVWNRVRIWGTGRHTPTKNSQEFPRVLVADWVKQCIKQKAYVAVILKLIFLGKYCIII